MITDYCGILTLNNNVCTVIDLSSGGSGATDEDQLSESALTLPPPPLPVTAAQVVAGEQKKSKRTRTAYSQIQQDLLELAFHVNPYPDGFYRQKVALDIGIPEDRVQVKCVYTPQKVRSVDFIAVLLRFFAVQNNCRESTV